MDGPTYAREYMEEYSLCKRKKIKFDEYPIEMYVSFTCLISLRKRERCVILFRYIKLI